MGFGIAQMIFAVRDWSLVDMEAYWSAAMRVRDGGPLYPALRDTTTADVYRYAPWFAYAWVPLTFLPKALVGAVWTLVLVAATGAVSLAIVRHRTPVGVALGGLVVGMLILIDSTGNVHALLIAALLFGVERRTGPLWIAVAASLKVVPILFVLVYVGRGQWRRVGETLGVTFLLVAPMLLFDLSNYPVSAGELSYSLFDRAFPLWAAAVTFLSAVTVAAAAQRSAHAWLAAATAAVIALPRLWTYDFTFVAVGLAEAGKEKP
ncbi:MAG: glycosyltransferase family 87 protein [Chloroflexota bacterium]